MRLIYDCDQSEVKLGDEREVASGSATIVGITKPHKPGSTGRVYLEYSAGGRREFFPAVIGATWIEREDQE